MHSAILLFSGFFGGVAGLMGFAYSGSPSIAMVFALGIGTLLYGFLRDRVCQN